MYANDVYSTSTSSANNMTDILYSYEFAVRENNDKKADAILVFSLKIDSTEYPFRLE